MIIKKSIVILIVIIGLALLGYVMFGPQLLPYHLIIDPPNPQNNIGRCLPRFMVQKGQELTASEAYASYCSEQGTETGCGKVDIYNRWTGNFGNSDGMSDCKWVD